jgi:integrase
MLLLATWDEINFDTGEWTIPKEHVKGKKGEKHEHVVFMSAQVAAMFRELKALAGRSGFVLPGRSSLNKPFAKNALNKALDGLTFDMIRSQFMTRDERHQRSLRIMAFGKNGSKKP